MYFPYLYGRGAELLALRDVSERLHDWNTVPVVEPTKIDGAALVRCLAGLRTGGARCHLVVNPSHGEFKAGIPAAWTTQMAGYIADQSVVIPTFQISAPSDGHGLSRFLADFAGREVGVVVRSADVGPANLAAALVGASARVFLHTSSNPHSFLSVSALVGAVPIENQFNVQARNADYNGSEWFTSSHRLFLDAKRSGFSDFTLLPNTFSDSGGPPGAVAVHLSYIAADGSVWVQHFVSDSVDVGDGDVGSKMAEVVAKIDSEINATPGKFVSSTGLAAFSRQHANSTPTGLATSKRQQIAHHLATVGSSFVAASRVSV
ncbi:sce7725 family protein [Sanguibacter sp. 25GB23B1]|uniref:sce7725 family protein n=1 Tax=unclassified Sanguibacter TaxID=2645534 RepID=UPI0032AF87C5